MSARKSVNCPAIFAVGFTSILSVVAIWLFVAGWIVREPGAMTPPSLTVPPVFEGNAAAYRLRDGANIAEPPTFSVRLINRDESEFRDHLANLAARRHWAYAGKQPEEPFSITYVMPDHDVALLERLASNPYNWADQPERKSSDYLPRPSIETFMPAAIVIHPYQPADMFWLFSLICGFGALVMAGVCTDARFWPEREGNYIGKYTAGSGGKVV